MKFFLASLFVISLFFNYQQYCNNQKAKIGASFTTTWHEDYLYMRGFGGYLKWNDPSQQGERLRQHWRFYIDGKDCRLIDTWEWIDGLIASDIEECRVVRYNPTEKVLIVVYKDATITVFDKNITWITSDPNEKGGGTLVDARFIE